MHLRRCPGDLPERMDGALAELAEVEGMILDFRANGGGGFDHDGLLGRFVPTGRSLDFAKRIESAGPRPYGGPLVVIVDAGTRSAGETGSGMFKEDGRAYMIGESPTAGMSASKKTIELPSKLFALYVAVRSNKQRFNGGRGLEGIGAVPHETLAYDPADLAAGRDTLLLRAEELLGDFPSRKVPYDHTRDRR
ncbi:MAG: S41 family peptidase [Planctomycetota bacterium]|nr:S41 family peptidase [Planctomycetota bacterium]MDP6764144.1 S41 family peptidase [Planctomycetota bacterium]MDP6988231.1 S41 family peptidase [Planctomycetota bacterium]